MYFKSTLEFIDDVHFELRAKDVEGIYITIEQLHELAPALHAYDGLAELATEMHVMNILVSADRILEHVTLWKHLEPTHVRLDPSYRYVI